MAKIKKFSYLILLIISLVIFGNLLMFALHICPPQGPWPNPPWCNLKKDISSSEFKFNLSRLSYIGKEPQHMINSSFSFGIGMMDLWGNLCTTPFKCEDPKDYVDSSLNRIKKLNADLVMITDFYQLDRLKNIVEVHFGGARTISKEDIKSIVEKAHNKGLKVMLITNLYEKDHSRDLLNFKDPKKQEIDRLFAEWSKAIIKQAGKGNFDYLIINPRDIGFFFSKKEDNDYINKRFVELLPKIREQFKGKVCLWGFKDIIDGFEKYYDCIIVDQTINDLFGNVAENLKAITKTWKDYLNTIRYNKTTFVLVLMPSYDGAMQSGWIEPVGQTYDNKLKADYKEQALIYEGFFRALKDNPQINGVIAYGYWWNDKLFPNTLDLFRNDLSHSIRDKDAEMIFYKWANNSKR